MRKEGPRALRYRANEPLSAVRLAVVGSHGNVLYPGICKTFMKFDTLKFPPAICHKRICFLPIRATGSWKKREQVTGGLGFGNKEKNPCSHRCSINEDEKVSLPAEGLRRNGTTQVGIERL